LGKKPEEQNAQVWVSAEASILDIPRGIVTTIIMPSSNTIAILAFFIIYLLLCVASILLRALPVNAVGNNKGPPFIG
jgi:hypothetical protein